MAIFCEECLVSVAVITYNSSRFIVNTLESIKNQTYNNIELIISDDYSTDNTIEICRNWLSMNSSRFVRTEIIQSTVNTGITANINRAYIASRGVWIKPIAGDDALLEDCVENNMIYINANKSAEVVFSKMKVMSDDYSVQQLGERVFDKYHMKLCLPQKELKYLILCENFIPAATTFMKKALWQEMGGFDESIPMMEDWPFWIKLVRNNKHLYFNPIPTVFYRMHYDSISLNKKPSDRYMKSVAAAHEYAKKVQYNYNKFLWLYARSLGINFIKTPIKSFAKFLVRIINPISYYMLYINYKIYSGSK